MTRADFEIVIHQHWSAVYRLLSSLTGDAHQTEDLAQETFLRGMRRFSTFRQGTNLRAWLLRIASNAFLDDRRKRKRARSEPLNGDLAGPAAAPGHALETAERSAVVRSALAELSDLTRLVFHLRVQEDLSFREIAELAGTTEQSARWHMRHARVYLLTRLGEDF